MRSAISASLRHSFLLLLAAGVASLALLAQAQEPKGKKGKTDKSDMGDKGERGSLVEDRTARKLIEAGDARLEGGEAAKAVEVWQSVIERYPRSRVRFDAHLKLG